MTYLLERKRKIHAKKVNFLICILNQINLKFKNSNLIQNFFFKNYLIHLILITKNKMILLITFYIFEKKIRSINYYIFADLTKFNLIKQFNVSTEIQTLK